MTVTLKLVHRFPQTKALGGQLCTEILQRIDYAAFVDT
jgi:hypothetical protein